MGGKVQSKGHSGRDRKQTKREREGGGELDIIQMLQLNLRNGS